MKSQLDRWESTAPWQHYEQRFQCEGRVTDLMSVLFRLVITHTSLPRLLFRRGQVTYPLLVFKIKLCVCVSVCTCE